MDLPFVLYPGIPISETIFTSINYGFLLLLASRLINKNNHRNVPLLYWVTMIAVPVVSCIGVAFSFNVAVQTNNTVEMGLPVNIILSLFLIFAYLHLYNRVVQDQELILRSIYQQSQMEFYESNLATIMQAEEKRRKEIHDTRYGLANIKVLANRDNNTEICKIVDEMVGELELSRGPAQSGNIYVDGIINHKANQAHQLGTVMKVDLCVPYDIKMASKDLSRLLGNALDNAIEACEHVRNAAKIIHLDVRLINKQLLINIANPYAGNLFLNKSNLVDTSKSDKRDHGFGLQSIREVVDKYNGILEIRLENQIFELSIIMENERADNSNSIIAVKTVNNKIFWGV